VRVSGRDTGEIEHRRGEVDQLDEGVRHARTQGYRCRRFHGERDARQVVLVRVLILLDESVVAREVAVVAEEEDRRVFVHPRVAERLEHEPELVIDRAHMPR